ncbi:neuroblastoma breakpoint family member 10-like [Octodon degus]|uniref:Neuroblastoma breakpoint family member 10-like n=1 Tax=Octodon degus TaxID=10160 RepID=A0A6P6DWY0_OCTDE|nr:neuroblastoma breakpoint family member 10-like [Octodon degus]
MNLNSYFLWKKLKTLTMKTVKKNRHLWSSENADDWKDEVTQPKASRKYFGVIHYHVKELTQLRKQLREGRDASFSLGLHLEFLLTQDDPEVYQDQGHMQHLAQGCKMAEDLDLKLKSGEKDTHPDEREL